MGRLKRKARWRSGVPLLVIAVCLGLLAGCSNGATSPTIVGTWRVTYGTSTVVEIESTGTNEFSMTASTPVMVVGGSPSCHLAVGTILARFSGSGTSYKGHHGLWSTTNCSFAYWTTLSLALKGKTAIATLGNGESLTLTEVPLPRTSNNAWLWLLLVLLVLAAAIMYVVFRRRRRTVSGNSSA